jgi:hypothetical protein
MFAIDKEASDYFKQKLQGNQAVRVFFGGFG